MTHYLQQVTEHLRKVENSVKATTNVTLGDVDVPDIPEVIFID